MLAAVGRLRLLRPSANVELVSRIQYRRLRCEGDGVIKLRYLWPVVAAFLFVSSGKMSDLAAKSTDGTGSRTKVIFGGTLIDGTGRAALPDAVIVIRDGRVVSITSASNAALPADAQVISARGKFIVPGLIDGHSHYRSWVGELDLNHGVTSIIDVGNPAEWMLALREGIAKGKITRLPRIYSAGNALSAGPNGATSAILLSRPSTDNLEVGNAEEARRVVIRQLDVDKFDFVSIFSKGFTPDMLQAVMEEAHKRGKRVFGHVDEGVFDFIRAGGDAVTHLSGSATALLSPANLELLKKHDLPTAFARMEPAKVDEFVSLMVRHHVYLTPELVYEHAAVTDRVAEFREQAAQLLANSDIQQSLPPDVPLGMLSLFERVRSYGWRFGFFSYKDSIPPVDLEEFRVGYRNAQTLVRKFVLAGGKLEVGTDASGGLEIPGLNVLQEMQLLVDAGLTPMQALQSATSIPAEAIGVSDQVGTIQPGRFADIVVLDANPLENMNNIHKISMVFQNGERIEPGYHWNYALPIPDPNLTMDTKLLGFNDSPKIFELKPKMVTEGDESTTVKVNGIGFMARSQVLFNGVKVPTKFESDQSLSVEIPASLLVKAGTGWVQVTNPPPGGGRSTSEGLIVKFR